MKVFEFEKSLLNRLEESSSVLQLKGSIVPARDVRNEWACHVELKIEPAGWQSVWRMNRATCELLNIKYPTVVFGMVNNVYFDDLKAEFSVIAVQDEDIHLPEVHEVPLEELWPTIDQENAELNIERTADCLDELRFFYRNVWMPWDNDCDDEVDWSKKYLESRIRFCFDLKRNMSRAMADHIRKLLTEARYIQCKREHIDMEMKDDESFEDDPEKVNHIMRIQLRLVQIRNEIEILENPMFRRTYEEIYFTPKNSMKGPLKSLNPSNFIVTKKDTISGQIEYLDAAKAIIGTDQMVNLLPSLKDCFNICASRDHILVPFGKHPIKLIEPLNSNGYIRAIDNDENKESPLDSTNNAVIACEENDSVLLTFNGDYTIESVTFDCRNVRLGIWCKSGTITLKNCCLIGDNKSSTCIGINVSADVKCVLENTLIKSFGTAITCVSGGLVKLKRSMIENCDIGLDLNSGTQVECTAVQINNCSKYGLMYSTNFENLMKAGEKRRVISDFTTLKELTSSSNETILAGIITFRSNKNGNIVVIDQTKLSSLQYSEMIEDNYDENGFANGPN